MAEFLRDIAPHQAHPFSSGIEIVTPSLAKAQADKVAAANDRWFAAGTFTHVPKQKSNIPGQEKST